MCAAHSHPQEPRPLLSAAVLEWLAAPEAAPLLHALAAVADTPAPSAIEALRRTWGAERVAAALEVQLARTRGADKFGARVRDLWLDREGAQMASSPSVAAWKARRFAGQRAVTDLCCGIGGDLMELARVAPARGVELDEARAWMAARNSGAPVEQRNALMHPVETPLVHADPARRSGSTRLWTEDDLLPNLAELQRVMAPAEGSSVKLGPGMDLRQVPEGAEVEFISQDGTLVQQVLWTGCLAHAPGQRTATRVCVGATITGTPGLTPCTGSGQWLGLLAVPDPALERARLVHLLPGAEPAPGLGILTADAFAPSPWLTVHRIVAQLPPREHKVAAWLRQHHSGTPVVHTRGKACDPDAWQAALREEPTRTRHHVWVLRVGAQRQALITLPSVP